MANTSPSPMVPTWSTGDRLRKAREYANLDVTEMAEMLGCSRNSIGNYEHDRVNIKRSVLIAYHFATGVPVEWLEHGMLPAAGDDDGGSRVTLRRTDNVRHLQIAA